MPLPLRAGLITTLFLLLLSVFGRSIADFNSTQLSAISTYAQLCMANYKDPTLEVISTFDSGFGQTGYIATISSMDTVVIVFENGRQSDSADEDFPFMDLTFTSKCKKCTGNGGSLSSYLSLKNSTDNFSEALDKDKVKEGMSLFITGTSFGAAIATLAAIDLADVASGVYTYGQDQVTNRAAVRFLEEHYPGTFFSMSDIALPGSIPLSNPNDSTNLHFQRDLKPRSEVIDSTLSKFWSTSTVKTSSTISVAKADWSYTASTSTSTSTSTGTSTSSWTSTTTSTGAPSATATTSSNSSSSGAPYFVMYGLANLPDPADIPGFNVLILAFWGTASEYTSNLVASWEAYFSTNKAAYTSAGIKVLVSAFGSSANPTTEGVDPTSTADALAAFVKQYDLDGVDVDYEDSAAFSAGTAEAWLITFTTELRNQLPSGQYLISHAPQAPYFRSSDTSQYPSGGYMKVHSSVGSIIDFYNVQYYNQGTDSHTTCQDLIVACTAFPQTAVQEIVAQGVVSDKIVIGKLMESVDGGVGFMAPSDLATCVSQAKISGWNAGLAYWQYHNDGTAGTLVSTSWGSA